MFGSDAFKVALDSWLLHADQKSAYVLEQSRNSTPQVFRSYGRPLYRGMIADGEFLDALEKGTAMFSTTTSWTKDRRIAERFVSDPSLKTTKNAGVKVILEKRIIPTKQVLDVESFVLFMGAQQLVMLGYDETNIDSAFKEKEVIVQRGLRIGRREYTIID